MNVEITHDPGGFTLVELMVALSISGLVILGARAMFEQLANGGDRVVAAAVEMDHSANLDWWLRRLVLQTDHSDPQAAPFIGTPQSVHFTSWCGSAGGWQEPCRVSMTLDEAGQKRALIARVRSGTPVVVRAGVDSGWFLYLYSVHAGGEWLADWVSRTDTPLALGIVLDGDTLVFRIGERG